MQHEHIFFCDKQSFNANSGCAGEGAGMLLKDWKPKYIKSLFPPKPLPHTHEALAHTQLHTIMLDYGCPGMTCFVSIWLGSP